MFELVRTWTRWLYGQRSQSEAPKTRLPILSEPVSIFDIPSLLTPFFTGRDSHLDKLRDILQPPTQAETSDHDGVSYRRAAIHGVPGAGKTQLALKYASLCKEHYSAVFFVSAARIATLKDGYERIVSLLDLPQKSSDVQGVKVAAAREWFEKSRSHCGRGWLLIVDNINSDNMNVADDLVRDFLPRDSTTPRGSIILTTRNLRAAEIVVGGDANLCIEAGEMNEQEAVDLLSHASGKSDDRNSAQRIAKELGYLPLAINQAATYTKAVNVDFEHFLKDLREENDEIDWREDDNSYQSSSTTKTYMMAFRELAAKSSVSADLFCLFSFLDPEKIPADLLTEGAQGVSETNELHTVIKSPLQLAKMLEEMQSGLLVRRLEDGKENIWIHDLVQNLCRQWLKPSERCKWAKRAIDVVNFAYPDTLGSLESWKKARKYLEHGLACTKHAEALQIQTINLSDLMSRLSWYLRQIGDLAEAERLAIRAVDCAKFFGEGQRQHMDSVSGLALVYYHQSRFREAKYQWRIALEMARNLLGEGHVDIGIGNDLALVYYEEGCFVEAESFHSQIYERRKKILTEQHPETLGALGSLANTYHFQGHLEKAVLLKKQILEGRRKYMGEDHPETLGAKGSLATTYSDQATISNDRNLLAAAEQLQEEVMKGREEQFGKQHPEFLAAKGALSYTYYLQRRLAKAEEYQQQVLEERKKLWGIQHRETLGAMRHLAKTFYLQGRLDDAARLQEEVVLEMDKLRGKGNAESLSAIEELSKTYIDQGLFEKSEELRERVLKGREILWDDTEITAHDMEAFFRKRQGFAH